MPPLFSSLSRCRSLNRSSYSRLRFFALSPSRSNRLYFSSSLPRPVFLRPSFSAPFLHLLLLSYSRVLLFLSFGRVLAVANQSSLSTPFRSLSPPRRPDRAFFPLRSKVFHACARRIRNSPHRVRSTTLSATSIALRTR